MEVGNAHSILHNVQEMTEMKKKKSNSTMA